MRGSISSGCHHHSHECVRRCGAIASEELRARSWCCVVFPKVLVVLRELCAPRDGYVVATKNPVSRVWNCSSSTLRGALLQLRGNSRGRDARTRAPLRNFVLTARFRQFLTVTPRQTPPNRRFAKTTRLRIVDNTRYGEGHASPAASSHTTSPTSPPPSRGVSKPPTPRPSSTPPARACSVSRLGSCKVCVF